MFQALDSEFITYKSNDFRFEIYLPNNYEVDNSSFKESALNIQTIRISSIKSETIGIVKLNYVYRVISQKIVSEKKMSESNLKKAIFSYINFLTYDSFKANNLVVKDKKIRDDSNGLMIYYVLEDEKNGLIENRKIIMKNNYVYILSTMALKKYFLKEKCDLFFNSLKIKK